MKSTDPFNDHSLTSSRIERFVCLVAALIVFTFGVGRKDIVTSHEGRVAQTARIMADSGWPWNARATHVSGFVESNENNRLAPTSLPGGRDSVNPWLFPVINDAIRLQKPPLPYWVTAVVFKLFGVSEFNARIVPALLGAIATLLVWDIARFVLGRRAALPAAIVWITMRFVTEEFRKVVADPYLTFFTLATIWAWLRAKPQATWAAMAFGALAKGPVIVLHVVIAIACARIFLKYRARSSHHSSPRPIAHLLGVLLFLAIVLPWPAMVLRESPGLWRMWLYEAGGNVEKARVWWNYLASSPVLPLPWTPLWIAGFVFVATRAKRRVWSPRNRRRMFAIAWYLVTLVFFSCLDVKKDAYLLPEMAAQALIVADALAITCAVWARRRPNYEISVVLAAGQCAIGIGFAAGLMYSLWRINAGALGMIVCAIALIIALFTIRQIARHQPNRWLMWQFAAYALILISMQGFYGSASDNQRSPKQFAASVRAYLETTDVPLLVTRLPEEASFYLPLGLRDHPNAARVLILVDKGRRDPPVDARRLSELLGGATVRGFQRVILNVDDGADRYQLFDAVVDRSRA